MKRDKRMYIFRIGDKIGKYGYTNNIIRRLKELERQYKKVVTIYWVSEQLVREDTAKRNEQRMRKELAQKYGISNIPNDRFEIIEGLAVELSIRGKRKEVANIIF